MPSESKVEKLGKGMWREPPRPWLPAPLGCGPCGVWAEQEPAKERRNLNPGEPPGRGVVSRQEELTPVAEKAATHPRPGLISAAHGLAFSLRCLSRDLPTRSHHSPHFTGKETEVRGHLRPACLKVHRR